MQLVTVKEEDNQTAGFLSKGNPEGRDVELSMRVKYSTVSKRDYVLYRHCNCTARHCAWLFTTP